MAKAPDLHDIRRYWDKQSGSYDKKMGFADRRFFGDTRQWACGRARGDVLEVAVGTGLNLEHYPADVRLTGIDISPAMLEQAKARAADLGRAADLRDGNAQALEFADASFDTVLCTFSLCAVPDDRGAVAEMVRVLRPGGRLLLADHVVSSWFVLRAVQATIETFSIRSGNEHFRRRPIRHVRAAGLAIEEHERLKAGIIERLAASKPGGQDDS